MGTFFQRSIRAHQRQIRRPVARRGKPQGSKVKAFAHWLALVINWVAGLFVAARKDAQEQSLAVINTKYHRMVLRHVGVVFWILATISILLMIWFVVGILTFDFTEAMSLFKILPSAAAPVATWSAFTHLSRAHEKVRDDLKKERAVEAARLIPDPTMQSTVMAVIAMQYAGVQVPSNEITKLLETMKAENISNNQEPKAKALSETSDEGLKSPSE